MSKHYAREVFLVTISLADGATLTQQCFAQLSQAEDYAGRQLGLLLSGERVQIKAFAVQGLDAGQNQLAS